MKKLVLAFCMVVGGLVAVNAQDSTSTDKQQSQYPTQGALGDDQEREKINSRDLPDAVKRSLEGTEYRGWLISSVYKTKGMDQSGENKDQQDPTNPTDSTAVTKPETNAYASEIYVVELKNGAQTKTVRFDKDGKKLDEPKDDKDNK
jgi:hypothetical protein